jgi:Xaa-Pro dipeptidase
MDLTKLFHDHLTTRLEKIEKTLATLNFNGLIIGTGSLSLYCEDDQGPAFRPYHHFAALCPAAGENHLLCIRPGLKPLLLFYSPQDFWYEHIPLTPTFWTSSFEIDICANEQTIWQKAKEYAGYAYIGPEPSKADLNGFITATTELKQRLNWQRSYKTEYEIHCTTQAMQIAARGHIAARESFHQGGSELDIYHAYLVAARLDGTDLPYGAIVALNEKGAVLHYQARRDDFRKGDVLLIDMGASHNGYAADITRTYARETAPAEFKKILKHMDELQQSLCSEAQFGISFSELHHRFHMRLASVLIEHGLVRNLKEDSVVTSGITRAFCPHGLGHMLGVFVHDVAGRQKDETGTPCDADPRYPTLRTNRKIEEGLLFTLEPGLYFIEMLLNPLKSESIGSHINWQLIDMLAPCGGIRIEDNIFMTSSGPQNLTRPFLP